jgi:hypothetical protein
MSSIPLFGSSYMRVEHAKPTSHFSWYQNWLQPPPPQKKKTLFTSKRRLLFMTVLAGGGGTNFSVCKKTKSSSLHCVRRAWQPYVNIGIALTSLLNQKIHRVLGWLSILFTLSLVRLGCMGTSVTAVTAPILMHLQQCNSHTHRCCRMADISAKRCRSSRIPFSIWNKGIANGRQTELSWLDRGSLFKYKSPPEV